MPEKSPETRPADCPSCGAPDGADPAGPCRDPYHDPEAATLLPADERYMFSGPELGSMLLEVAGATSGVFLRRDPTLVMPAEEVEGAVFHWVKESKAQIDAAMISAREAPREQREQVNQQLAEGLIDIQAAVVNAIGATIDSAQRDRVAQIGELVARLYRQIAGNEAANGFGAAVNERAGRSAFPAAVPSGEDEARLEAVDALVGLQAQFVREMATETSSEARRAFSDAAAAVEKVVAGLVREAWGLEATMAGFPEPEESEAVSEPGWREGDPVWIGWGGQELLEAVVREDAPADATHVSTTRIDNGNLAIVRRDWVSRRNEPKSKLSFSVPPNPKMILLMRPQQEYRDGVVNDADVVISHQGIVIKNRHGYAGLDAGDNLLADAQPVWPPGGSVYPPEEESLFPTPEIDPKLSPPEHGFELTEATTWTSPVPIPLWLFVIWFTVACGNAAATLALILAR